MPRLEPPARELLAARDRFLETGDPSLAGGVRPDVLASWQRSLRSGVDPTDSSPPPFEPHPRTDGQLIAAADAVLAPEAARLASTSASLFLSDQEGRLVRRWAHGGTLNRDLDRVYGFPGFSLDESRVGTNAVGTVFETGKAAGVRGGEHYLERFLPFACVGVPIHHPVHRRVIGALDASCRVEEVNGLLMPWAMGLARDIERWLFEQTSRDERLLLERFVTACATPPHRPTICLNDRTIISNPAAARLIGGTDQALLWEQAGQAVEHRRPLEHTLLLADREVEVRCVPVEDDGRVVGVVVQVLGPDPRRMVACRTAGRCGHPAPGLPGFVARSSTTRRAGELAVSARTSGVPLLVRGETGTGKATLLRAVFHGHPLVEVDAALLLVDGPRRWLSALRQALGPPGTTTGTTTGNVTVVRHLESVPPRLARTVCSVLDSAPGALLAATATTGDWCAPVHPSLLSRFGHTTVELAPMRDRPEDLPALLATLGDRLDAAPGESRTRDWSPDAVQALARAPWPGNVAQLEAVVRGILAAGPIGRIQLRHLPDELRAPPRRRTLARLDRGELEVISETMRQTRGNKLEAAALLGVSRSTLYRRLRTYGIDLTDKTF